MRIFIFIASLALTSLSATALGQTKATDIRAAAIKYLETFTSEQATDGYTVSHEVGTIDSRIALAACQSELAVEFTGDPWRSTQPSLQVSCAGPRPWRLFVTAKVTIDGPALIAAQPLARGARITQDMLATRPVTLNASRLGVIKNKDEVIGMEVRRPINSGSVITPNLLSTPDAVERGDHVIIIARRGSFAVSSRGKALGNASVGEQVLVENLRSARTLRANVVAPGRVEIPM